MSAQELPLTSKTVSVRMSGMDVLLVDHNETGITPIDNGTFLHLSPTSASTSAAASSPGHQGNVYVLKNIISSSSSVPDCSSEGGSSFTNMEICSISSTVSALSTSGS
ncbi:serine rich and transmembrane domain containing 1 isoform X2 [Kryptolebias marmoratus]|uniref:serine rich and transmembrane domain containing 1 isoform X2 n=1 Tax=Kryptolebias marmoratus TaxID=37003 RepID=UPI0007F87B10|nr:serine rich and transmembrane domain containing 1 isoform X2 [Kryptolebias marmoratus]